MDEKSSGRRRTSPRGGSHLDLDAPEYGKQRDLLRVVNDNGWSMNVINLDIGCNMASRTILAAVTKLSITDMQKLPSR